MLVNLCHFYLDPSQMASYQKAGYQNIEISLKKTEKN